MNYKFKFLSLILCLILTLPLGGCSDTSKAYIYFELPSAPLTLDPQTASLDQELLIVKNIFEGLLRKNDKGEIVCGAAESYNKNNLTYTFKIRENAFWSNGEPLTAHDFVFSFRRAVKPETKAPFVARLFSITNAESIYNGKANAKTLGVTATDDKTLVIKLNKEDKLFEETLTTSISMPCNEAFFNESAGKYGLFSDNILSNSSYKITRWRKDPFGIRLYKNDEYKGDFEAQNAAVFITCNPDEPVLEKLEKKNMDIAFIDCALTDDAEKLGLTTKSYQNICWVLTLGNNFSKNMRTALSQLIGEEVFKDSLPTGYAPAYSIYPECISSGNKEYNISQYNPENAKKKYLQEVARLDKQKFPSDIILYYYENGNVKNVVTDIVGRWQSNFSAFVNIESVSDPALIMGELQNPTYAMTLFPVSVDSNSVAEYLKKYGISYNGGSIKEIQNIILESNNILPIMFQNTVIAHTPNLSSVSTEFGNGYIDFSFIIKTE